MIYSIPYCSERRYEKILSSTQPEQKKENDLLSNSSNVIQLYHLFLEPVEQKKRRKNPHYLPRNEIISFYLSGNFCWILKSILEKERNVVREQNTVSLAQQFICTARYRNLRDVIKAETGSGRLAFGWKVWWGISSNISLSFITFKKYSIILNRRKYSYNKFTQNLVHHVPKLFKR